jgi:hypothetical protein
MLKVHENIGNQRIKFAATISDSAEDLLSVGRSIEKERKKVCLTMDIALMFYDS